MMTVVRTVVRQGAILFAAALALRAAAPELNHPTGKDPMGFAFSADGKTALVANHGDGTVTVVDLSKMQVDSNFTAGTGIETLTYY